MSILEKFHINKYKKLLNEIEMLNIRNVNGYNTFLEYVKSDKKMISYFNELKKLEKKCNKIHVDSNEIFENNVFKQLKEIYEKKLFEIFKIENNDEKLSKLNGFKEELNNCLGYGSDNSIKFFINDIDKKIKNVNNNVVANSKNNSDKKAMTELKYKNIYDLNHIEQMEKVNSTDNIISKNDEEDDEDELLDVAIESVIENGQASTSFIQRRLKVGYARAGKIIDQMEERGIISGYQGSKPREVLITKEKWQKLKMSNINNQIKINNEDDKRISQLSNEEIMKMYGIDAEYTNNFNVSKNIHNCLIIENAQNSDKIEFLNTILKNNSPLQLKLILVEMNSLDFNFYANIPHLLIPIVTNIEKVTGVLDWILQEINNRLNMFVESKSKNIIEYNEKTKECKLPEIIIFIDEIYEILKVDENKEILIKILLNSEITGIKFVLYSKFSKKNLNIGSIEDLVQIYTKYSPNIISQSNFNKQNNIKEIDNDMNGFDFEKFTGDVLHYNGFEKIEITQKCGDFGIDIVAYKDDIKYAIQCKRYSTPVGIKAVQEVVASKIMNNCHVAVVITNNYFTNSAIELAKKNNVLLWNRDKLIDLINNAKLRNI